MNIYDTGNVGSISATWLYSETAYQLCAYHENIYTKWSAGSVVYFSTTAKDSNRNWEVTATGPQDTGVADQTIVDIVSYEQGVNPKRNVAITKNVTAPTTRRL